MQLSNLEATVTDILCSYEIDEVGDDSRVTTAYVRNEQDISLSLSLSTRELHKLTVKNPSVENSDTAVNVFDP